jgi:hypothetical protein
VNRAYTFAVTAGVAALVVGALSWFIVKTIRDRRPYSVDEAALSGWTVAKAAPGDPAVVALQPPPQLSAELFRQVSRRSDQSLVAPAHASVPLVLKGEFEDSLQGVHSLEDMMSAARDAGLEETRFEPVCMGEHRESASGAPGEVFFAVFHAPGFDQFRQQLTPLFPEHAGAGIFDPPALRLILAVASTDGDFARWWPIAFEPQADCRASIQVKIDVK